MGIGRLVEETSDDAAARLMDYEGGVVRTARAKSLTFLRLLAPRGRPVRSSSWPAVRAGECCRDLGLPPKRGCRGSRYWPPHRRIQCGCERRVFPRRARPNER